jgi:hypothetical protein
MFAAPPPRGEKLTLNANHARPLAAFWLLAIAAAVVTGMGLRSDGGSPVRPAPPSTVTSTGAPELVLGGVLRAGPTLTGPSAPGLSAAAVTPGVGTTTAEVAAPRTPDATHKARTNANGQTATPVQAQATQTTRATTATGHVKGRHKKNKATSTATATTSHDHGPPTDPGKGH